MVRLKRIAPALAMDISPSSRENTCSEPQQRKRRNNPKITLPEKKPEPPSSALPPWITEDCSPLHHPCKDVNKTVFFCAVIDFLKSKTGLFECTGYKLRHHNAREIVQEMIEHKDSFALELCRAVDRGEMAQYFSRNPEALHALRRVGYTQSTIDCLASYGNSVLYHHAFASIVEDSLRRDRD